MPILKSSKLVINAHKDFFGRPLKVGDYVVMGGGLGNFSCNVILRFTPKMVRVRSVLKSKSNGTLQYANAMMLIDPHLVTMYMLTRRSK